MNKFDTIAECVDYLSPLEAYQNLLGFITDDYENALDELSECDSQMLDRQAGKISAYREILSVLEKM